jgi:hypothetical protein
MHTDLCTSFDDGSMIVAHPAMRLEIADRKSHIAAADTTEQMSQGQCYDKQHVDLFFPAFQDWRAGPQI